MWLIFPLAQVGCQRIIQNEADFRKHPHHPFPIRKMNASEKGMFWLSMMRKVSVGRGVERESLGQSRASCPPIKLFEQLIYICSPGNPLHRTTGTLRYLWDDFLGCERRFWFWSWGAYMKFEVTLSVIQTANKMSPPIWPRSLISLQSCIK